MKRNVQRRRAAFFQWLSRRKDCGERRKGRGRDPCGRERARITVTGAVVSDKGRLRKNNEDNFYFNGVFMDRESMDAGAFQKGSCREELQIYAVCDGMGGTDSGEEASCGAVRGLAAAVEKGGPLEKPEELTRMLRGISEDIYEDAAKKSARSGTTIALMALRGEKASFANVGDSRIYRLRRGSLRQLSLDHSRVQRMISMGILMPEEAKRAPWRHVITQYLGMPPEVKIVPHIVAEEALEKDDMYLLCSDGLTDMVEDLRIEAIMKEKGCPGDAARALLKAALDQGGRDNATIMVLKVEKEARGKKGARFCWQAADK